MLGSVLGVPGTGRTGAGRRGLSMEVAEAALKFPDAFEALVKTLEIGGFWTLPAGRARYGALFVGITAGQAGMWPRGMGAVPWPCRAVPPPACSSPDAVAGNEAVPAVVQHPGLPSLSLPCALVPSHPRLRNSHASYIFYSLLKEQCQFKNRVS